MAWHCPRNTKRGWSGTIGPSWSALQIADMNDEEFTLTGEMSPEPSRATRGISRRSKHSSRGGIVVDLPGNKRPRVVQFESKLEQRVLFLYLANHDVVDIWEQPPFIRYRDEAGKRKHHFFDFLVVLKDGRRLALAVKPWKIVQKSDFPRELRRIRAATPKEFAHEVVLVTDRHFTRAEALNAQRFVEFSRSRNPDHQKRLEALVRDNEFPRTVGELSQLLNLGGHGFRAVVIAIYEGLLKTDKRHLIDLDTLVCSGGLK